MNKTKKYADQAASILKRQCKKKTNKLVYADKKLAQKVNCKPEYVPKILKTCGTKIRYCTAKEVKLMTQKRDCDCRHPSGPLEIRTLILTAAKAAAILGVVYITYDLGFWGVPRVTEQTFASLCEAMPCKKDPCKSYKFKPKNRECEETLELLKVPTQDPCSCEDCIPLNMEKCSYKVKQLWNHTVIFIFEGIANAPNNIINFVMNKWNNLAPEDCGPCRPIDIDLSELKKEKCELVDDYEEKYPAEKQCKDNDCQEAEEELQAFIEEKEDK